GARRTGNHRRAAARERDGDGHGERRDNPIRGSTPARMEKEIASGMRASATTRPPKTSMRRRRNEENAYRNEPTISVGAPSALAIAAGDGFGRCPLAAYSAGRLAVPAGAAAGAEAAGSAGAALTSLPTPPTSGSWGFVTCHLPLRGPPDYGRDLVLS